MTKVELVWDQKIGKPKATIDLVFFDGSSNSQIKPWHSSTQQNWVEHWLPWDLSRPDDSLSFRIFSGTYKQITNWNEQFPLLDTSKQFLSEFKRKKIGSYSHSTIFLAWGFDVLLLKQIIYLSSLTKDPLFSSILGVISYGSTPQVKNFQVFTEEIEKFAVTHKIPKDGSISSRVPVLLDLHHVFSLLAEKYSIKCLSFGSVIPSLPGKSAYAHGSLVDLLSSEECGEYHYLHEKDLFMSCFETPEDFGYYRTVEWIHERCDSLLAVKQEKRNEKKGETQEELLENRLDNSEQVPEAFTIGVRERSLVLSKGVNTSEALFQRMGKELTRHPKLINRIAAPSLFEGLSKLLEQVAKYIYDKDSQVEAIQQLRDLLEKNKLEIHLVGEQRKVTLAKAFIGCTFQFLDHLRRPFYPASLHTSFIRSTSESYDMSIELRHVLYMKQLLHGWREVKEWSPNRQQEFHEEEEVIKQLSHYMKQTVTIAITGRLNSGKSVFLNGTLGRNIFPSCSDHSAGCSIELRYTENSASERVEIHFVQNEHFLNVCKKTQEQLEITQTEIQKYEDISNSEEYPQDIVERLRHVDTNLQNLLIKLQEEYDNIMDEFPSLQSDCPSMPEESRRIRDSRFRNFLKQASVCDSPIRCRLIQSAIVYLHHPLLKSVTLVRTPALTDKVRANHIFLHTKIQGWLYLVPMMHVSERLHEDIENLNEWSSNGIVVMTKFDEGLTGLDNFSVDQLINQKREVLLNTIHQASYPAVSMRILYYITEYSRKTRYHIVDHLDRLVRGHVGMYFTSPDYLCENLCDDSSEDSDDWEDHQMVGYTNYLRAVCDKKHFRRALIDSGKEASLLMSLLTQIYDKIDSDFITQKFNQLLCQLTLHLNRKLVSISDKLQITVFEIQNRDGANRKRDEVIDIDALLSSNEKIATKLNDEREEFTAMTHNHKETLLSDIITTLDNLPRNRNPFKKRLRARVIDLYSYFDKPLTEYIEHALYQKIFSEDSVRNLLQDYPDARDTVILSIQGLAVNKQRLKVTIPDEVIELHRNKSSLVENVINNRFGKIWESALTLFDDICSIINDSVQFQIRQQKALAILQNQNSCASGPPPPISLLLTRLTILKNEYERLQNLFSSVTAVFFQHKIQERSNNVFNTISETEAVIRELCGEIRISCRRLDLISKGSD